MELTNNDKERYSRQMVLKQFGETAQLRLLHAKVLVVGAGGLGCPFLQYLVAAGVGTVGIVDNDVVALSNLHRQVVYTTSDIGLPKAERAATLLRLMNPAVTIQPFTLKLTNQNALDIFKLYDVIVDATDNFASRYLINDACVLLKKPLVHGSVQQYEGQVAVFNVLQQNATLSANYRDLFPQQPSQNEVPNCREAGVIGVLPGIIGTMMANECIKLLTGIGSTLVNQILTYNALNNTVFTMHMAPQNATATLVPATEQAFTSTNYSGACAYEGSYTDVGISEFLTLMQHDDTVVIDVREVGEKPLIRSFNYIQIPVGQLEERKHTITQANILLFCYSGVRSVAAALLLSNKNNRVYNLKGGIIRYNIQ